VNLIQKIKGKRKRGKKLQTGKKNQKIKKTKREKKNENLGSKKSTIL